MADLSLLLEAEKRGLLPPEKALLLQEARSRGLVSSSAIAPEPEKLGIADRIADKLVANVPGALLGDSPWRQAGVDFATGASGLMRGGANLLSPGLGEKIWPKSGATDSGWRTAGEFADPVALAVGGGVAKALPIIPYVGRMFAQGGYAPVLNKAATTTAPAISGGGLKAVAQNLASGAAAGGAIGGLSDEGNIGTGSALGAGLNIALPSVLSGTGKAVGKLVDALRGDLPSIAAGKIVRESLGKDLPAGRSAFSKAPGDLTAAQAAAGIKRDTLNALDDVARNYDKESYFTRGDERQRQSLIDTMRRIAGGANQTDALQTRDASSKTLNALIKPMYETELGAANIAGTTGRRLQGDIDRLRDAAASKVEDVRRMASLEQRARETNIPGQLSAEHINQPRLSGRYGYIPTDLPVVASRAGKEAAESSLALGGGARLAQYELDSIAAHGLKPVDTSRIIGQLQTKLSDPSSAGSKKYESVMTRVSNDIQDWTAKNGGQIDAEALYAIKKNSVNEAVEDLTKGLSPKSSAKFASKMLAEVRPMIDDAIENAGATGWRDLMKTVAKGKHQLDQQKMGAIALNLLEKSPNQFESLVNRNEPKMVQKVFENQYDIGSAMGDKIIPMRGIAEALARDRGIKEGAKAGEGGLGRILAENTSRFKFWNVLDPKVAALNRALGEIESRINEKTMDKIVDAMKTGASAKKAIDTLPFNERNKVIKALASDLPYVRAGLVSAQQGD